MLKNIFYIPLFKIKNSISKLFLSTALLGAFAQGYAATYYFDLARAYTGLGKDYAMSSASAYWYSDKDLTVSTSAPDLTDNTNTYIFTASASYTSGVLTLDSSVNAGIWHVGGGSGA